MKIGAYYFDGWRSRTERLKREFAHREPLWGWLDGTQTIMAAQLAYAANAGVSFFAFDWYYPEGEAAARHIHVQQTCAPLSAAAERLHLDAYTHCTLNEALRLYLETPDRTHVDFCLLVANHAPFRILADDWDAVCALWLEFFASPGYVTLEGRPLLIIYHPHQLVETFGTPQALSAAFEVLRKQCRAHGIASPVVAACSAGPARDDVARLVAAGYDAFTGYNYRGAVQLPRGAHAPFALLQDTHEDILARLRREHAPALYPAAHHRLGQSSPRPRAHRRQTLFLVRPGDAGGAGAARPARHRVDRKPP